MEAQYLRTFHIAGFAYHQGIFVFNKLTIGSKLTMRREPTNTHDTSAIELLFKGHKVGYVPRSENAEIAKILDAGHDIFMCVVQQLSPAEHPAQQVRLALFIKPAK